MNLDAATVLIVDDEVALREIFARWLRQIGCGTVFCAANGAEAVEIIEQHEIDVLITDVRMPVMDGVALVRRLAEMERHIACVIFVSGFGDVDPREMYDLGVEAFLAKPFRLEDLATSLKNAISERQTLWLTPMPTPPRQLLRVNIDEPLAAEAEPEDPGGSPRCEFRLGRGGFSTLSPDPLGLGKVAFECQLPGEQPEIVGQGYVRWRSKADLMVGIEFAFLDSPGREWILGQIEEKAPRSYIPGC